MGGRGQAEVYVMGTGILARMGEAAGLDRRSLGMFMLENSKPSTCCS